MRRSVDHKLVWKAWNLKHQGKSRVEVAACLDVHERTVTNYWSRAWLEKHGLQYLARKGAPHPGQEVDDQRHQAVLGLGLAGYLRDVRREVEASSPEALAEVLRRREKYAGFERKRSPWPPAIYVPLQRSWSWLGGGQPLFIADHCPQLVEAYDAFGEEEATIYQIFMDELTRPLNGTNGKNSVKAAEQRYEGKKKLLLAVLDRLCEAKEFPGECPFCPDHAI